MQRIFEVKRSKLLALAERGSIYVNLIPQSPFDKMVAKIQIIINLAILFLLPWTTDVVC